jgi:hypothetical protein
MFKKKDLPEGINIIYESAVKGGRSTEKGRPLKWRLMQDQAANAQGGKAQGVKGVLIDK